MSISFSTYTQQHDYRNDPSLFNDDVDIKFSRSLDSCKLPRIRFATKDRLFKRFTDLRFLSKDFIDTFLLTHKVFTASEDVLQALKNLHYNNNKLLDEQQQHQEIKDTQKIDKESSIDKSTVTQTRVELLNCNNYYDEAKRRNPDMKIKRQNSIGSFSFDISVRSERKNLINTETDEDKHNNVESESLMGKSRSSSDESIELWSAKTLNNKQTNTDYVVSEMKNDQRTARAIQASEMLLNVNQVDLSHINTTNNNNENPVKSVELNNRTTGEIRFDNHHQQQKPCQNNIADMMAQSDANTCNFVSLSPRINGNSRANIRGNSSQHYRLSDVSLSCKLCTSSLLLSCARCDIRSNNSTRNHPDIIPLNKQQEQHEQQEPKITGNLMNKHDNQQSPVEQEPVHNEAHDSASGSKFCLTNVSNDSRVKSGINRNLLAAQDDIQSAATDRVLRILSHWICNYSTDIVCDTKLCQLVDRFLQDLTTDTNLSPNQHEVSLKLRQMLQKMQQLHIGQVGLDIIISFSSKQQICSIERFRALEVAESMTYLDHEVFSAITSGELLDQAWMKKDKDIHAPNVLMLTKRFNDISRLISSEIVRETRLLKRVEMIEKWTTVAHICRILHNFNGVLIICTALHNSSVCRLKKTWAKVPKIVSFSM